MRRSTLGVLLVMGALALCQSFDLFRHWWGITEPEQIAFVILIVTATLWISELVPLFVTSFIIILLQTVWLLPAMNAAGGTFNAQSFLSPFFSDIILLFLGGFVISAMLHKYNLDLRIAKWILGKAHGNADSLLLAVILISALFSMWMSNTATAAMMFAVIMPITATMPKESRFPVVMALAIAFACNLGGIGTPIGTPANAIAISYLHKSGIEISFAQWMILAVPVMLVMIAALWRLLLFLYPSVHEERCIVCIEEMTLSARHYSIVAIFIVTCIGWITTDLHGYSAGMVGLIPVIACFGFRLLNTQDFRSLSWDVLVMLGGGLSLGVGLKESGLIAELVSIVPTSAGPTTIMVMFGVLALLMSTFISNTATANLVIPITVSLGGNAPIATVIVAVACSSAMALPVSTPPNALAFGSGFLTTRQMAFVGGIVSIAALVLLLLVSGTYWKFLGIL